MPRNAAAIFDLKGLPAHEMSATSSSRHLLLTVAGAGRARSAVTTIEAQAIRKTPQNWEQLLSWLGASTRAIDRWSSVRGSEFGFSADVLERHYTKIRRPTFPDLLLLERIRRATPEFRSVLDKIAKIAVFGLLHRGRIEVAEGQIFELAADTWHFGAIDEIVIHGGGELRLTSDLALHCKAIVGIPNSAGLGGTIVVQGADGKAGAAGGHGSDGENGEHGADSQISGGGQLVLPTSGTSGSDGSKGKRGANGDPGGRGPTVSISTGEISNVHVIGRGGAGGDGGSGGRGGRGGDGGNSGKWLSISLEVQMACALSRNIPEASPNKFGGAGGDGGDGGTGGNGAPGGVAPDIFIAYEASSTGVVIHTYPGIAGHAGAGGEGGEGGQGGKHGLICEGLPDRRAAAGARGSDGVSGQPGAEPGASGYVDFMPAAE